MDKKEESRQDATMGRKKKRIRHGETLGDIAAGSTSRQNGLCKEARDFLQITAAAADRKEKKRKNKYTLGKNQEKVRGKNSG